ncbi:MAG: hypothetical protein J6K03_07475 [Oscillospiraceae bacterium]|nr:hypothetical protein [Oscillospiraceae bacterium]
MRKALSILLVGVISFGVLSGCAQKNETEQENPSVFSFHAESDGFTITNGVIVLGAEEEVFYGGDLKINDTQSFANITSFSATFYTMTGEERRTLLSNSVIDQTGNTVNMSGDLGKTSGGNIILGSKVETEEELVRYLYFELVTTNKDGEEFVYQVPLTVTEITE